MRSILSRYAVALLLVMLVLPGELAGQVQLRGQALRDAVSQYGGRVIVGLKPTGGVAGLTAARVRAVSLAEQGRITASLVTQGLQVDRQYQLIPAVAGVVPPGQLDAMLAHPNVEYIEPDYPRFTDGSAMGAPLSRDAVATSADSIPYGVSRIRATLAWSAASPFNTGAGVKVGVLDTGGDPLHPDLLYAGGYDALHQSTLPAHWTDCDIHGTHVAGTVAARSNGFGVVGVAPGVSLYALKFADASCQLPLAYELDAIQWAVANGLQVINMSFGAPGIQSISEHQTIQAAEAQGVLFVGAAGNISQTTTPGPVMFPAAYPEVIAVASTDFFDNRASTSAYGPEVDVAAPGDAILSTVPGGGYAYLNGTSMASPHVTGLVALLKALRPSLTQSQVAALLTSGVIDLGAPGRDDYFGAGRIDALNSVNALLGTPPSATPLTRGSPVSGLSGGTSSQSFYVLSVPSGASSLTFTLSAGSGNADLYVQLGALPTTTAFDCRSQAAGNSESCTIPTPAAGDWYVMVLGTAVYSGVTLTANYGGAAQLLVAQQPGGAVSGLMFGQQPAVQLADAQGTAVSLPGVPVTASILSGPGAFDLFPPYALPPVVALTDASGRASFAGLGIAGAGIHVLQFTSPRLVSAVSAPFTVALPTVIDTLQPGVPRTNLAGSVGADLFFVIDVPQGATDLTVNLSGGTGSAIASVRQGSLPAITTPSCSNPCLVPTPVAGPWYVKLSTPLSPYSGKTLTASYLLPGAHLVFLTQPGNALVSQEFPQGQAPRLQLTDAQGQPVHLGQVPLTVSIATGSGAIDDPFSFGWQTSATGDFSFTTLAIDDVGPHTLQFSSPGLPTVVSQTFDVALPPLTTLSKGVAVPNLSGPSIGGTFLVFDVPAGASNLTFTVSGGAGVFDLLVRRGTLPRSIHRDCGVRPPGQTSCSFAAPVPGTWYVQLAGSGLGGFSGVTLVADYASSSVAALSLVQGPGGAVTQIPFTQQPIVQLLDGQGSPVAVAGVPVTASIASGSGQLGGVIPFSIPNKLPPLTTQSSTGPTVTTDASGRAVFTDLTITGTGSHTLQFSAASVPPVFSQAFTVAATPTVVTLLDRIASTGLSGGAGSRSYFQITVPSGTPSLTFQTGGGAGDPDLLVQTGALPTLLSHACLSASHATAESCTITNPAPGVWYAMVYGFAPFSGIGIVASLGGANIATHLTMAQQPVNASSGYFFAQPAVVQLSDAQGLPVAKAGVLVTATVASGTGQLSGTSVIVTDGLGRADFSLLSILGSGPHQLSFSAAGLGAVQSQSFTVNPPQVTVLQKGVPVSNVSGGGGSWSLYRIDLQPGATNLTLTISGGIGSLALQVYPGVLPAHDQWPAPCSGLPSSWRGTCVLSQPVSGPWYLAVVGVTPYSGVSFTADYTSPTSAATQLLFAQVPAGATSGLPLTQQPIVQLADAQGQPVSVANVPITVTIASGTGQVFNAVAITGANGAAAFSSLMILNSGQNTLAFSVPSLPPLQAAPLIVAPPAVTVLQKGAPAAVPALGSTSTIVYFYSLDIPAGMASATFGSAGGPGNVDLYVSHGGLPGEVAYDCVAAGQSATESCALPTPAAGTWTVAVRGFGPYSNVTVAGDYTPGTAGATQLTITRQPGGAVDGVPFTQQPIIQLADAQGAPFAQAGVPVTATVFSGPGVISGSSVGGFRNVTGKSGPITAQTSSTLTDAAGVATFTSLTLTGAGQYVLEFSAPSLTPVQSQQFTVAPARVATPLQKGVPVTNLAGGVNSVADYVLTVPAGATQLSIQTSGGSGDVDLYVQHGSLPDTIANVDCASTSVSTVESCLFNAPAPGSWYITLFGFAAYSGVTLLADYLPPSTAAQLVMAVQPGGAVSGIPFTQQPAVQLADAQGQPVAQAGVQVSAAILSGTGQLSGTTSATTNASGLATFTNLAIAGSGQHVLQFTATGLATAQSLPFAVTATVTLQANVPVSGLSGALGSQALFVLDIPAGAQAVAFFLSGGSGNADLRVRFGTPPTLNSYDCLDAGPTNSAVCSASAPAAGSWYVMVSGTTAFTGATILGTYNTSSPAVQLSVDQQPAGAATGAPFVQQPIVGLADAQGQLVQQSGVVIAASLASGTGQLSGTTSVATDIHGFAWFTDLVITGTGSHTLQFTSPQLRTVQSVPFTVGTQLATQLQVLQQPGGAVSGLPLTQQPTIQLADAQGSPVPQAGIYVLAKVTSGTGQLTGLVQVATNSSGVASFTSLTITGSGPHVLTFSTQSLAVQSVSFNVAASPAALLQLAQQPGGAVTGLPFTQQPSVQLADAQGQAVSIAGVTVVASLASGSGQLGGTTQLTSNASGLVAFTNLAITGTGQHVLQFSALGLTGVQSAPFTVSPPQGATQLLVVQQPGGAVDAVPFTQQPTVQLADAQGQSVAQAGTVVTASILTGSGVLGGTITASTNTSGLASFSNLTISGTGQYVLQFSATGLSAVQSAPFAVTPPVVTQLQPGVTLTNLSGAAGSQSFYKLDVSVPTTSLVIIAGASSGTLALRVRYGALPSLTTYDCLGSLLGSARVCSIFPVAAGSWYVMLQGISAFSGANLVATLSPTATQLSLSQQPGGAVSAVPFTQQPVVQVQDSQGNAVSQAGIVVTASLASGPGQLSGTLQTTTGANGAAAFTDLAITGTGAHVLAFSAPGLTGVQSATFNVGTALASQLLLIQNPAGAAAGVPFTQQPIVQVADAQGQAVASAGIPVTAAILTGAGQLSGTTTVSTVANGTATFTDLALAPTGSYTLSFTAPNLSPASSGTVTVVAPLAISTTSPLTAGTVGTAYSQALTATGGTTPYTWSLAVGNLPAGLALNSASGAISGTPTASGTASFTLQVDDAGGRNAQKAFTLTTVTALAISTAAALPGGTVAVAYNQPLTATGGAPPYTWSVAAGSLPPGLSLITGTGTVTGTPTGAGAFSFTAQVNDAGAHTAQQGFTLTILGVPATEVTNMVASLTGGPSLSPAEVALYDCNGSAGFDLGDLLCYLDANPTLSLSPGQLALLDALMVSDNSGTTNDQPRTRKD